MPSWSCIQMEVAEMVRDPLYRGLSKTAWALLLIYIDLEVNQMDLLPDFVGYLLILSAIGNLKGEERDLILLRPLGILLAVWSGVTWAVPPLEERWQFWSILIIMTSLYFVFQLVTNLASIAAKYQLEGVGLDGRLLRYRNRITVLETTNVLLVSLFQLCLDLMETPLTLIFIFMGIAIAQFILAICLVKAVFDLRRCARRLKAETG